MKRQAVIRSLILASIVFCLTLPVISEGHRFSLEASFLSNDDNSTVGNLSGNFSVNPQGNAIYNVSLTVSPGTAGLSPSLGLRYDSSAGNGILGMGFNLAGITAITRVNSNYAQNGGIHSVNFTSTDRFALDGQQLVAVNGTYGADGAEYRTYIDSQARIFSQGTQGNGPAGFEVQTKGGQTAWYGTTQDSQILAQGKNTVAVWALAKIQDQAGNYITYHYTQDNANGAYYPSEIDYTGNDTAKVVPYNSIKFIYEQRPDPITNYQAGSIFKITQRLKEVQAYEGNNLIYDYKINYETSPNTFRSRITSIQECAGDGGCLKPLNFTWQTNQMGWVEAQQWKSPELIAAAGPALGDPVTDYGTRFIDLTGNGKPGIVHSERMIANLKQQSAYFNTGNGWTPAPISYYPPEAIEAHSGYFSDLAGNGQITSFTGFAFTTRLPLPPLSARNVTYDLGPHGWQKSSFNIFTLGTQFHYPSDSLGSAFCPYLPNISQEADILNNGSPFLFFANQYPTCNITNSDQAMVKINGQWQAAPAYALPASLSAFHCQADPGKSSGAYNVDFGARFMTLDNTGMIGLVLANDNQRQVWSASLTNPANSLHSAWSITSYNLPDSFRFSINALVGMKDGGGRITNLTGGGLSDLLMAQNGNHANWINTGLGWIPGPSSLNPPTDIVHGDNYDWYDDGVQLIDVTDSGLPAYLQCSGSSNGGKCRAWLNENNAWVEVDDYAPPVQITDNNGKDNGVRFIDLLGTGFPDIIINNGKQDDAWLNKAQTKPDVITHIQDALGDNLQIQYKPITDNSIYTKGNSAQYPNMDVQAPIYVVAQTASDNAVTPIASTAIAKKLSHLINTNTTQHVTLYHYENAVLNHLGWGFLGFGQVIITDQSTGISTTINYSQNTSDHTLGMPLSTLITAANGTVINKRIATLSIKNFGNGQANGSWFFPYVSQSVETAYDLNTGALVNTKTTTTQLDDDANPIDIKEVSVDSTGTYSTETKNTYLHQIDVNHWWLGELTRTQVIASSPIGTITRTSNFTYDPNNGFLASSTIEPGSSTNELIKNYKRDAFGNIVETDMSGANIASRSEKVQYDTNGEFIISKTNALNQITQYQIDPRFGEVTQTTDANGLIETNKYDSFGRLQTTIHPDGTMSTVQYRWSINDASAPAGSVYEIIQTQTGSPEKIIYRDELDRVIGEAMQGYGGKWIWQLTQYNDIGLVAGKTLPFYAGEQIYETTSQYDVLGRAVLSTNPDGGQIKQSYNGYSTTTINPKGQTSVRTINVRGNMVQTIDAQNHITNYQYDAFDDLIKLTDSKGNVSTIKYDNMGHKMSMHDVDRGDNSYFYDALGEILSQTDAKKQTTTYQYDLLNRMITRTDPSGVMSSWQYDNGPHAIGKLVSVNGVSNAIRTVIGKTANGKNIIKQSITAPNSVQRLHATEDNMISYSKIYSYDNLSRPSTITTTLNGQSYTQSISYDTTTGKVATVTYPSKVSILSHYDAAGYLTELTDATTGQLYSQINNMDADGHVISETHSNGLITNYIYDPKSEFLLTIETIPTQALALQQSIFSNDNKDKASQWKLQIASTAKNALLLQKAKQANNSLSNSSATDIQNIQYQYDLLGNVTDKNDAVLNVKDHYDYDNLNRIKDDQTTDQIHNQSSTLNYVYDELGNITNKSDVGQYNYGENAGPHAVTSIAGLENDSFTYDAIGDQTQAIIKNQNATLTRNISYTSFDVPKEITQTKVDFGSKSGTTMGVVDFYYDANHARFMRQDVVTKNAATTKVTTFYLDNYEVETTIDNTGVHNTYRTFIGDTVLMTQDQGPTQRYDILKDNIGSTSVITDQNGNVMQRFHYDPFGVQTLIQGTLKRSAITRYGFTGQEEVNAGGINLIHMNGRMYDPHLGRFLSADPTIQEPSNAQSLNRYSYGLNDPLAFTDPTGFSFFSRLWDGIKDLVHDVFHVASAIFSNPVVDEVLEIAAVAVATWAAAAPNVLISQALGYFAEAAAFDGVVTYAQTGNIGIGLRSAAMTFLSECVWAGTGAELKKAGANWAESTLTHGVVGGGLGEVEGGSFKDGFLTASVTQALSGPISRIGPNQQGWAPMMERGLASGIVGGTVAAETGGNFENAMLTSAISEMCNDDLDRNGPNALGASIIHGLISGVTWMGQNIFIPLDQNLRILSSHITVDTEGEYTKAGMGVGGEITRTRSGLDTFIQTPEESTEHGWSRGIGVSYETGSAEGAGYVSKSYVNVTFLSVSATTLNGETSYGIGIHSFSFGYGTVNGYQIHHEL